MRTVPASSGSVVGAVAVRAAVALAAAGCDGGGPARFELSDEALVFGDIDPSAGPRTLELEVRNVGAAGGDLSAAVLTMGDALCGTFALVGGPTFGRIDGGGSFTLAVQFTPDPTAGTGCACHATATLALNFTAEPFGAAVAVLAHGPCDESLLCAPSPVEFPDALIERESEDEIECYNVRAGPLEAGSAALAEDGDAAFTLGPPSPPLPATLAPAGKISLRLTFAPDEEGPYASRLVVRAPDGTTLQEVEVVGQASRERPLCSAGIPPDPEPVLEADGYAILLESDVPSSYAGVVRAFWFYGDQPPLIADVLVTSGGYADPACEVSQSGHYASWSGAACTAGSPDDLFVNVHALPFSDQVEAWIRSLALWDRVTVRGYEVDRIDYDDGSWWTDAGCHTLIITWVCDTG
jgi:hypothetical protein